MTDAELGYTLENSILSDSDDEEEESKTNDFSITPEEAGKQLLNLDFD
jgi:hypothetical protein